MAKIKDGMIVACGGAVGASLRYITDTLFFTAFNDGKLISLFTVNTVGSFILGLLTSLIVMRGKDKRLQLLLGTGLCGSFTTMSGFASASHMLVSDEQHIYLSLVYISFSVVAGIFAAWMGFYLGQRRREVEEA